MSTLVLVCVFALSSPSHVSFSMDRELSRSLELRLERISPIARNTYLKRQCGLLAHSEAADVAYTVSR